MTVHTCSKCGAGFKRPSDLARHEKNKKPCRKEEDIIEAVKNQLGNDSPTLLTKSVDMMTVFDALRAEGIVGISAHNYIVMFLSLRLLEPIIASGLYTFNRNLVINKELFDRGLVNKSFLWSQIANEPNDQKLCTDIAEACRQILSYHTSL